MFKEKPLNVLLFCSIVIVCSAVLQYMNPGFSFFDGGLIVAIFLTIFLKDNVYTKLFGAIGIVLIVIAAFYVHEKMNRQQVIMQHLFSLIVIVMTIVSVLYVKKLYRSIESDERQVNALFEHATEGIILTNQKGEIILVNPAALKLFNYEKDDLLKKSIEILIPGRFRAAHIQYREGFYQHPSNRTMGHGRNLFARTRDGKEFPVEVSLSFYEQKNEFFVIAFVVDITERKDAEQKIIESKSTT